MTIITFSTSVTLNENTNIIWGAGIVNRMEGSPTGVELAEAFSIEADPLKSPSNGSFEQFWAQRPSVWESMV